MIDVFLFDVVANNDVILRDPTVPVSAIVPRDDRPATMPQDRRHGRLKRGPIRRREVEPVVVAQALMDDLVARYGPANGRRIYFEMEALHRGPFGPGAKYDSTRRALQAVEDVFSSRRRAHTLRVPPARRN